LLPALRGDEGGHWEVLFSWLPPIYWVEAVMVD